MTTIRDTITTEAGRLGVTSYVRQAEPIITALEQREERIVASLRSFAMDKGLSGTETDQALAAAGLSTGSAGSPISTPADGRTQQVPGSMGAMQDNINDLIREVSALKAAAERAGVHI